MDRKTAATERRKPRQSRISLPFLDTISFSLHASSKEDVATKAVAELRDVVRTADVTRLAEVLKNADKTTKSSLTRRKSPAVGNNEAFRKKMVEWDEVGETLLHSVVRTFSLHPKLVESFLAYCLKNDVDINARDRNDCTALQTAMCNGASSFLDDEILNSILNCPGVDVMHQNAEQNTALHLFCWKATEATCADIAQKIISKGDESLVNKQNSAGETALHKAAANEKVSVPLVKMLISNHADVNIAAQDGDTAMHKAIRLGRKELVKLLLGAGADIRQRMSNRVKNPYQLANSNRQLSIVHAEIADMLKSVFDLVVWLGDNNLERYLPVFIREELYLPDLVEVAEEPVELERLLKFFKVDDHHKKESEQKRAEDLWDPRPNALQDQLRDAIKGVRDYIGRKDFEDELKKVIEEDESNGKRISKMPENSKREQASQLKSSLQGMMSEEQDDTWLIKPADLQLTTLLGEGASGQVFKGKLHGVQVVAIKLLKNVDTSSINEFKKEFRVMRSLKSPYIIKLWGACLEPKVGVIMDFCGQGSLHDILNKKTPFGWDRAIDVAIQMAAGVHHIHSQEPEVLHRDLKSLNLLVTDKWQVKLADFGLARFNTSDQMQTMAKVCGTYHYLAPEMWKGNLFTAKSDVFSMGIILWELMTRVINGKYEVPHSGLKEIQILYQVAERGARPKMPARVPDDWKAIIQKSLDGNPDFRPTAGRLLHMLEEMKAKYTQNPAEWESCILKK